MIVTRIRKTSKGDYEDIITYPVCGLNGDDCALPYFSVMHPPGGRTGSGRIFNHDLGLRPVLLVPGELKKQDMKELEDAWFEETHIASLFQQLRTGGTPLGKLFDDARQSILNEHPAFADFLTDSTTPQRTQLATELQRTVTGMTLAASRNVPSFTLGDLAPSWMVSFWLSNENYSKLFADERRTRNTSIIYSACVSGTS